MVRFLCCGIASLRKVNEGEECTVARHVTAPYSKKLANAAVDEPAAATPGTQVAHKAALQFRAPAPAEENSRIKALHQLHALDDSTDEQFNSIVELVRATFKVDRALLSLIDSDRQIYKAKAGTDICGTDRQSAFGNWVLLQAHPLMLVVEDALEDGRFRENPLVVGPPFVRFYAGAPLVGSDGAIYGVLVITDSQPRHFVAEQLTILTNFSELCVRKLEAPRLEHLQQSAAGEGGKPLLRDLAIMQEAVCLCNLATDRWVLQWANQNFAAITGIQLDMAQGADIWALFKIVGDEEEVMADCNAAIFMKDPFSLTMKVLAGSQQQLVLLFSPASHGLQSSGLPAVGIPSSVSSLTEGIPHEHLDVADLFFARVVPAGTQLPEQPAGRPHRASSATRAATAAEPESPGPAPHSVRTRRSTDASLMTADGSSICVFTPPAVLSGAPNMLSVSAALANRQHVFEQVRLGPLLGSGAYGRVYRGIWRGAQVAVKVMDYYCPTMSGDIEVAAGKHSALLEALLGQEYTRHPCLIQAYDWGLRPVDPCDPAKPGALVRHTLWVVMGLANRGSLYDAVLKGRFRLLPSHADSGPNMLSILQTAQEIAGGMSLLHDVGIIHGDLSANNVLLTAAANSCRFSVAISDFGLARISIDSAGQKTETVGTVTHQPPELLREGLLSKAADVYALGILLWSLYSGTHPFMGENAFMVIHKVVSATSCPLELPDDAPADFKSLFECCVSYERQARPTIGEVLDLLAPMVEAAEAVVPPPSPPNRPPLFSQQSMNQRSISFRM